jgi:hypothetical protein
MVSMVPSVSTNKRKCAGDIQALLLAKSPPRAAMIRSGISKIPLQLSLVCANRYHDGVLAASDTRAPIEMVSNGCFRSELSGSTGT